MPSFRRFQRVKFDVDVTLVRGWRNRGYLWETGLHDPAATAPEFEARGLEHEGKSGCA
jgi:hypothetical protein